MQIVAVIGFVIAVDMLLLYATGRLLGERSRFRRYLAAALSGSVFVGLSLCKDFSCSDSFFWQLGINLITGVVAFGVHRSALRHVVVFTLLRLSVGGVAENENISTMLLGAAGIGFACMVLGKREKYVPIELNYSGKTHHIIAFHDTGNNLRDPITGKSVLIVDADVAYRLTGLAPLALRDPVNNLQSASGLRLIPYQSVGDTGFLLALHIPDAKVGKRQTSLLVALSPNLLSKHYQALTGGSL